MQYNVMFIIVLQINIEWSRILLKVIYGCDNQNLADVFDAKY